MASQSSRQGLFARLSAGGSEQNRYLRVALAPGGAHRPVLLGRAQTTAAMAEQQSTAEPCRTPMCTQEVALPAAGQLPWAVPPRGSPTHSSAAELPRCPGAGSRAPSPGMLVCKLPLYHIIMRCLGYQQISRRLGREGCSTIRKCQLAASSFCRSLNPIFLTCISATGTGPLHSDEPPGELQNIAMETLQRSRP